MAKHTKAKRAEKQAIGILLEFLNNTALRTELTSGDDDAPLIDGYVHLLDGDDEVSGNMLKIQLKPLKINKKSLPSITCSVDLLLHAKESSVPILLIGVDVYTRTANWIYLAPESCTEVSDRQIADGKKTATLKAPAQNVITLNVGSYAADWKRICLFHRNASNDRMMARHARRLKAGQYASDDVWLERIRTLSDLLSYRTNGGSYPMMDTVLEIGPGVFHRSDAVKLAFIDLLESAAYDRTSRVLNLLAGFALDPSEQVQNRTVESFRKLTRFDYHVLNAFGLRPYRQILDFVRTSVPAQVVIHAVLKNLLSADFDGSQQTEQFSISLLRGPLIPTPQLESIRFDAIEFLLQRFANAANISQRLAIIETLICGTRKSSHLYEVDETLREQSTSMVAGDTARIVEAFKDILYVNDVFVSDWPVAYEIEVALAWLDARVEKVSGVAELLGRVREEQGDYKLFRLLVGETVRLRTNPDLTEAQRILSTQLKGLVDDITDQNAAEYYDRLTAVAALQGPVKTWRFQPLRQLLFSLGVEKPSIASGFALKALGERTGLIDFSDSVLMGLRRGSRPLWYEVAEFIEENKMKAQVVGILLSILPADNNEEQMSLSAADVQLLIDISNRNGSFEFLIGPENAEVLEYHTFRALIYTSTAQPALRELLIKRLLVGSHFAEMYCHEISFGLYLNWISFDDWTKRNLGALADLLVQVPALGHDELTILRRIGAIDFQMMMNVFRRRMSTSSSADYEAVPYDIDHEFCELVRGNADTSSVLLNWVAEMLIGGDNTVALHIGNFLQRMGGSLLKDVVTALIDSGKHADMMCALKLLPRHTPLELSLALKFISASDEGDVWDTMAVRLQDYGVGSGSPEENIAARELRRIAANVEREGDQSHDARVKRFCNQLLANIAVQIENSEREHKKRLEFEREEFEMDRAD